MTHIIVAFVGDRIPRVLALFHFRVYVTARLITNRERKKRQNQPLRKLNSSIDSDSLHFYALLRSVSSTFFFCEREKKVFGQPCEVAEINEERFGISDSRAYRWQHIETRQKLSTISRKFRTFLGKNLFYISNQTRDDKGRLKTRSNNDILSGLINNARSITVAVTGCIVFDRRY